MRKFLINVNGNTYEIDVEEVSNGGMPLRTTPPAPRPTPVTQAAPAPVQAAVEIPSTASTHAPQVKEEVSVSAGQEVVEAPMPGNIWKVITSEGATVKAGDVLLILEAMKMENEIMSPRDGKVVSITTSEGSAVNTGDKLVIIE